MSSRGGCARYSTGGERRRPDRREARSSALRPGVHVAVGHHAPPAPRAARCRSAAQRSATENTPAGAAMRAIGISEIAGPLQMLALDEPQAGAEEVVLEVRAAGVANWDEL